MVKIRPLAILIPVIGAILVMYILFGITYVKQLREQEVITAQLAQLRPAIGKNPNLADLDKEMAAAQARLAAEQASFLSQGNSAEVIEWVLKLGEENQVKALPLQSTPLSTENINGNTYKVLRLGIKAEGSLSQLMTFISLLEMSKFKTLVMEKATLTMGQEVATASLNLAIYTQPPMAMGTPGSQ